MTDYPTVRASSRPGPVDRVLVGGKDITWFRATPNEPNMAPTRIPPFALMEPLGYGTSQPLVIPRTNSYFERPGTGDLAWLRKGATVLYERVFPDNSVVTDYRGFVVAIRAEQRNFTLDVWGDLSGRASLIYRPQPLLRRVRDVGRLAALALGQMGFSLQPAGGPVTNLNAVAEGGIDQAAWLDKIGKYSQSRAGAQRAIMPSPWGGKTFRFDVKDTTTKHYTAFIDGDRVAASLVDDLTEQPNTFWGTGTDPTGLRWKNSFYPGYIQGPADAYPIAGGAPFGIGTTDADTIDGDGITTLGIKLINSGFLENDFVSGPYDQAMADAVEEVQHRAGISPSNGIMTTATWDALWDISVTGFSPGGSEILPIVQDPRVRRWNRSSNGSIIGENDAFDPTVPRVDRPIDFGPGVSKRTGIDYSRGLMNRAAGKNWAGRMTFNGVGLFAGEWGTDDADMLNGDDDSPYVRSIRDVRPGQNIWVPHFDGGTLFHVSGVEVTPGGDSQPDSGTVTVDTQARDLLELSEILSRNRESKRDLRREWMIANRSAKPSGNAISRDEWFGKLGVSRALVGDRWNVIPIICGQSGTVSRVHLRTFNDQAEFCVAVFANKVTRKQLAKRVGNPFPVNEDGETAWDDDSVEDWFDDRVLLYSAGTEEQPCGYGRRRKFGPSGGRTAAPLTGTFLDDATWPYITDAYSLPVVYLAIYPDRDCTLRRGQLLYAQEDDVV